MTRRHNITAVAAVGAVVVVVGVVVAAWRPVMEWWYAARFADTSSPREERQHAANKLAEMGSPLLVSVVFDGLSDSPPLDPDTDLPPTLDFATNALETEESWATGHLLDEIRHGLREESHIGRWWAVYLLIYFGGEGIKATPELVQGMLSGDDGVARVCSRAMGLILRDWGALQPDPKRDQGTLLSAFLDDSGCDLRRFYDAVLAISEINGRDEKTIEILPSFLFARVPGLEMLMAEAFGFEDE